jgi:hypothetical protein
MGYSTKNAVCSIRLANSKLERIWENYPAKFKALHRPRSAEENNKKPQPGYPVSAEIRTMGASA